MGVAKRSLAHEVRRAMSALYEQLGRPATREELFDEIDPELVPDIDPVKYQMDFVWRKAKGMRGEKVPVEHPETGDLVLVPTRDCILCEELGEEKIILSEFATKDQKLQQADALRENIVECQLQYRAFVQRWLPGI